MNGANEFPKAGETCANCGLRASEHVRISGEWFLSWYVCPTAVWRKQAVAKDREAGCTTADPLRADGETK